MYQHNRIKEKVGKKKRTSIEEKELALNGALDVLSFAKAVRLSLGFLVLQHH
jgi:hypothetical protein